MESAWFCLQQKVMKGGKMKKDQMDGLNEIVGFPWALESTQQYFTRKQSYKPTNNICSKKLVSRLLHWIASLFRSTTSCWNKTEHLDTAAPLRPRVAMWLYDYTHHWLMQRFPKMDVIVERIS
jgi:hypothetical protein